MPRNFYSIGFVLEALGDWFANRVVEVYTFRDARNLEVKLREFIQENCTDPQEKRKALMQIPAEVSDNGIYYSNVRLFTEYFPKFEDYQRDIATRTNTKSEFGKGFQTLREFVVETHKRFKGKYPDNPKKEDIDMAFRDTFTTSDRFIDFFCESVLLAQGACEVKIGSGKIQKPDSQFYLKKLLKTFDITLNLYRRALHDFDYPVN